MNTSSRVALCAPLRLWVPCLLIALAAGQPCSAEHVVDAIAADNGQAHSNELAGYSPSGAKAIRLAVASHLDSVDTLGGNDIAGAPVGRVATGVSGSRLAPIVTAPRPSQDRHLQPRTSDSPLLRFYHRFSPPVTQFITENSWLSAAVSIMLVPIVGVVEHPLFALLVTMIVGLAGLIFIRYLRHHPD